MSNLDKEFHSTIIALAERIRGELQQCESLPRFSFRIRFEGRVHDGDMELSYCLGEYSDDDTSNSIDELLHEFTRRHYRRKQHEPLCLPNVKVLPSD